MFYENCRAWTEKFKNFETCRFFSVLLYNIRLLSFYHFLFIGRSFPEIPTNSSLLQRVGGDSRTLSPERKPHNYGFPKTSPHHSMSKSGSYNVYTHGQPPPIPPLPPHGLSHAASAIALGVNGTGSNPVPPPRAPINGGQGGHSRNNSSNNVNKQQQPQQQVSLTFLF